MIERYHRFHKLAVLQCSLAVAVEVAVGMVVAVTAGAVGVAVARRTRRLLCSQIGSTGSSTATPRHLWLHIHCS